MSAKTLAGLDPDDLETIRLELADHVATVTLDRPQVHNALNRLAYSELEQCFRAFRDDPEVRCVVVTGADPSFCSGDDVRELMVGEQEERSERAPASRPRPTPAALAVLECERPVIAAVNGAAVGWGMELALFADIRIASEKARFGELFVKRGLVSDVGGIWRLPQLVGPSKAAELLFTGDLIDAHEALRIGLVSEVVAHEELVASAQALAKKIAANPPLAVRFLKEGLRRGAYGDVQELGAWVGRSLAILFETRDHREGVQAFLEKREPKFVGR